MGLLAMAADKGSPGVTTAAVALAAVWPQHVLLAECDPSGSDVPYRLSATTGDPLGHDLGLVSLASAMTGQVGPRVLAEHVQQVDGGLSVLVGPQGPEQASAMGLAWESVAGVLAAAAGTPGADVIADAGRVAGDSLAVPILRRADLLVLLARDTVDGVAHLRHGVTAIARRVNEDGGGGASSTLRRTVVVLVTDRRRARQASEQVRQVLAETPGAGDVPVLGTLAWDPSGAGGLSGAWTRRLDRCPLITSARALAPRLHARLHEHEGPAEQSAPTQAINR